MYTPFLLVNCHIEELVVSRTFNFKLKNCKCGHPQDDLAVLNRQVFKMLFIKSGSQLKLFVQETCNRT